MKGVVHMRKRATVAKRTSLSVRTKSAQARRHTSSYGRGFYVAVAASLVGTVGFLTTLVGVMVLH